MSLKPATVVQLRDAGHGLFRLSLEVDPEVARGYHLPGQYVLVGINAHEADARPFAIASAPGTARFEFLVRRGFPLADALFAREVGQPVFTTLPMGPGFPVDASKGKDLLLLATGTGAASMRAVLDFVSARRAEFGNVTFVFGGKNGNDFAFHEDWPEWERAGIELRTTVSETDAAWQGRRGFVQQHLDGLRLEDLAVFVVGSPPMVASVKQELERLGVSANRVFLNT